MVVGRRPFDPCPPSPARAALDSKDELYIIAWLTDLAARYPDLSNDLPGYAKSLANIGYKTLASLSFMHPEFSGDAVTEVQKALKINVVLAKAIVAEGLALHPRDGAAPGGRSGRSGSPPSSGPRRRSRSRSPPPHERRWQAYSDKLNGGHTILESELRRFMESLLIFVYGQSDDLGAILRQFCLDPGMSDTNFELLNVQVSERLQRQLAAAIMPALPTQMGAALSAKLKPGVYGMVLLRAVCAHHYGPMAIKAKLLAAANLCYNDVVPVTQKCELR